MDHAVNPAHRSRCFGRLLTSLLLAFGLATTAAAAPSFSKAFSPSTIGPDSVSILTFTITNTDPTPATSLAFTDNLPMGMAIATPANVVSTCVSPVVSAPDGGSTIALTDGAVGGSSGCTISVNVTASVTAANDAGLLSSSAGTSAGSATATLTVDSNRPGFSKAFSPSTVQLGGRSTLTFTIDNSASDTNLTSLVFTDTLPSGLVIASPANASTDCGGASISPTLTAVSGSDTVSFSHFGAPITSYYSLESGATCTVTVDVASTGIGQLDNVSSELSTSAGSAGRASDVLTVQADELALTKAFTDDPVAPGGTASLEFTITNRSRSDAATSIAFSDDLDATLSGLAPSALPTTPCGVSSALAFAAGVLSLSGGDLAADGDSCSFSVMLDVPGGSAEGGYPNTTSTITADGGRSGSAASDTLYVKAVPTISKQFTDDPTAPGGSVTLEYTISNPSTTLAASAIAFQDELTTFLPFPLSVTLPANGFCGAGAMLTVSALATERQALVMSGGSLAASAQCVFSVTIDIPAGFPGGVYPSTSGEITATLNGETRTGNTATDSVTIVGSPTLTKTFASNPVQPGDTVTLQFSLSHDGTAVADATAIEFTDDLDAVLTGLAVTDSLPIAEVCGAGSSLGGTASNLSLTGGTLSPGGSCSFGVTVAVPANAAPGDYTNTTSAVVSSVDGVSVTGRSAQGILTVAGLTVTKLFVNDPVIPGDTVTLRYTLSNADSDAGTNASDILFTDSLTDVLPGTPDLTVNSLPATGTCGGTTDALTEPMTGVLQFDSGDAVILPGGSCVLDVVLNVPAGATEGDYPSITSTISVTQGTSSGTLSAVSDTLSLSSSMLDMTMEYTDDPVAPGGSVILQFTITNLASQQVDSIAFSDDLDASLSGLTATGLPVSDVCGSGSSISGSGVITLSDGVLAAGASCTFSVSLAVPLSAPGGTSALNTVSDLSGLAGALVVVGGVASDSLQIDSAALGKSFSAAATPGGDVVLDFTLHNTDTANSIDSVSFVDDLDAVISGLAATDLPKSDVCGSGSQLSGTGVIALTGANLLPDGNCSFNVTLHVPDTAATGDYVNTTSEVTVQGVPIGSPATATLTINAPPAPTFSKAFAPDVVFIGNSNPTTLTFTIDNSAGTLAATALDFTDNLPSGVSVATPTNASTTCTGGSLTAVSEGTTISYANGSVAAGSSCVVQVDVVGSVAGVHVNTSGPLTSSLGGSGTAADTLTVEERPVFSKVFAPDLIFQGDTTTLTLTVDNSASTQAVTGIGFNDVLPDGVVVGNPANASTTCTGGTLTALPGTRRISYAGGSLGAGASCAVQVDVKGRVVGVHTNTTSRLSSSAGLSNRATDTLTVEAQPVLSKVFAPDVIFQGDTTTLTLTVDNSASTQAVTGIGFDDVLPDGVVVGNPANASTTCTGGTLTAVSGTRPISYAGGSLEAGASCIVQVDVKGRVADVHANTTSRLSSSAGLSDRATDTLTVEAQPVLSKVFAPDVIFQGDTTTLTLTVDNSASTQAVTGIGFDDVLPDGVVVGNPANASTTCTGGTLTAVSGTRPISYAGGSLGAGASCTVQVDVKGRVVGVHTNTTSRLSSSAGLSDQATDDLTVEPGPALTKVFSPITVSEGGTTIRTFTIDK